MSTLYLGGNMSGAWFYAYDMYDYERKNEVETTIRSGNALTFNVNIGLVSASDY